MAAVGAKLTIPFLVGAGQIVGQGNAPELWCLYTTDDASNTSPVWNDATAKVRPFNTDRGRESELVDFNTGTASITVDNRNRTFDPVLHMEIRPLNRWWLREQFSGKTRDLFKGYAESYDNRWPSGGWSDAECVISCADEFKVLALDALPITSPVRSSYDEVVSSDNPAVYWRLNTDPDIRVQTPEVVEPNPPPEHMHFGPFRTPSKGKGIQ